jgi:hypothetical protein
MKRIAHPVTRLRRVLALSPRGLAPTPMVSLALILTAILPPAPALAQVAGSAGAGLHVQHFGFSDGAATGLRSVRLLTLPVAARVDVGGGVGVDLSSAWASGTLERAGGEQITLSGPTDTQLRVSWTVAGGWLTLAALGVVASGADGFSSAESEMAGVVAADLLPFRISHWGSGGGAGASFSAVHASGPWGFGGGAGYLVRGSFEPVSDPTFEYQPGNQLSLQGMVDRRVGAASRVSLSVSHYRHEDDAVDRQNLFRSGDRTQAVASWAFPAGLTGSGLVYGGYLHRAQGTFLQSTETRSSQGFLLLGGGLRQPTSFGTMVPSTDLRLVRREDGVSQGWLVGLGTSLERSDGGVDWAPSVVARLGSVEARQGVTTGVTGIEVGLRVGFGGGRP